MIIMILIIVWSKYTGKRIELIDWTIFATLVATLLLKIIAGGIKSRILNWLEDSAKLTENYGDLSSKYTKISKLLMIIPKRQRTISV